MLFCGICKKPVPEAEVTYWIGKNLTKDRKLQKIIEIPFCSPEHSLEWYTIHQRYEYI